MNRTAEYCARHGLRLEPSLGYCVRCLTEETDPPDTTLASFWWRRSWDFCRCLHPLLIEYYAELVCLRCRQPLRRARAAVLRVPEGEHGNVLDTERKRA